jgi:hypothetical protein
MADTRPVDNGDVDFLHHECPPGMLTSELLVSHEVLQGLVVSDEVDGAAEKEVSVSLDTINCSQHLTLIRGIVLLSLVEGAAGAGDHVLVTIVVHLAEDCC